LVKPGLMGDFLEIPPRAFMTGILLLALLVLVAACANLAGIFAARVADRKPRAGGAFGHRGQVDGTSFGK